MNANRISKYENGAADEAGTYFIAQLKVIIPNVIDSAAKDKKITSVNVYNSI